ncbi:MAG: metal-dependent transcriptional regulator [Clostridia bacterium]|nr:metal-dependent transcriptional regulator [Clostridia bacterium]
MNDQKKFNQSGEDYLESILRLLETQAVVHRIDVAKRMGVSQAAVNKAVKILVANGHVYEDGKHLYLTELGKAYAQEIYARHCIIRDYLMQNGVSPATAETDACKLEHLLSDETFQMMKNALSK